MAPGRFRSAGGWLTFFFGLLFIALGLPLVPGGMTLIARGGSVYYLAAGVWLIVAGVELMRERASGIWLYAIVVLGTLVWSLDEVGLSFWGLVPRVALFAIVGVLLALSVAWIGPRLSAVQTPWLPAAAAAAPASVALGLLASAAASDLPLHTAPRSRAAAVGTAGTVRPATLPGNHTDIIADGDWPVWGRTDGGQRYSPLTQITADNVAGLQVAWVAHTGATMRENERAPREFAFEATPLKIRDKLFLCTPHAEVLALDPDTGAEVWRFDPHANLDAVPLLSCRGVSYYAVPGATGVCAHRIFMAGLDAKLYALDADTGARCTSFGRDGEVNLTEGLGTVKPGFYYATSPPQIIRGRAVVGGWVWDNVSRGEPSGVVRAFDAVTGALSWAMDVGRLDRNSPPPPGETYTRGTPNVWTVMSADHELGLVFVPTGNETPDFFGAGRQAASEKYGSSLIALDAETGHVRWSFQTVHHDLWDFDLPAQPVLADVSSSPGDPPMPVVVVPTKQGLLFVLDRRNGHPLTPVEERPVPQGAVEGDSTSPTQPVQTDLPFFGPSDLTEASMWGVTPIDQLWCRNQFRALRYDGLYTPPSLQGSISYPGSTGVFGWGSVSIDPTTNRMIANTSWMPMIVQLAPRGHEIPGSKLVRFGGAAEGTPYEISVNPFVSPAGLPCHAPPYGHITALDLNTRQIAWRHVFGTARDTGPYGVPSRLPVPSGIFSAGGSLTTAGGLLFIGATADATFRALDLETGTELWHDYLPTGAHATPMTYTGRDGRQYVVIATGGDTAFSRVAGDSVIAFALPKR